MDLLAKPKPQEIAANFEMALNNKEEKEPPMNQNPRQRSIATMFILAHRVHFSIIFHPAPGNDLILLQTDRCAA